MKKKRSSDFTRKKQITKYLITLEKKLKQYYSDKDNSSLCVERIVISLVDDSDDETGNKWMIVTVKFVTIITAEL